MATGAASCKGQRAKRSKMCLCNSYYKEYMMGL